jgi:hypothetical protein
LDSAGIGGERSQGRCEQTGHYQFCFHTD